jgi:hypothetical protein
VVRQRPGLGLAVGHKWVAGVVGEGSPVAGVVGNRVVVADSRAAVVDSRAVVEDNRAAVADSRAAVADSRAAVEDRQVAAEDNQAVPLASLAAEESNHT